MTQGWLDGDYDEEDGDGWVHELKNGPKNSPTTNETGHVCQPISFHLKLYFFLSFSQKVFVFFPKNLKKFTITTKIFQLKLTNQTDPKFDFIQNKNNNNNNNNNENSTFISSYVGF